MKTRAIKFILWLLEKIGLKQVLLKVPTEYLPVKGYCKQNQNQEEIRFIEIAGSVEVNERPPIIIGSPVSKRFIKFYRRYSPEVFVAVIPGGRVLGQFCNLIISPDNKILSDVSREFGAEGGKKPEDFSVFVRLKMPPLKKLRGKIAVITTLGSSNFHHWNFDILPRVQLLKKAGLFDEIDFFLVHYTGLPFQKEGLQKMGIDGSKIINTADDEDFYIEAEKLYVTSLTEDLGTITPWVVDFLRDTFLKGPVVPTGMPKKIYLSRKKAMTRQVINEKEVMDELYQRGFTEFFPEDHSMSTAAACFANAESIVSLHGSGLANLVFVNEGTKVLDIMGPYHQDGYYWMVSNQRNAKFVGMFAEGEHPADDHDLIKGKVDHDLLIDMQKFRDALDLVS